MTTKSEIERWLDMKESCHTHMVVIINTINIDGFPVFVSEQQDIKEMINILTIGTFKVHEVYNLGENLPDQVSQIKAWNI